jgi:aminopeptidase N
MLKQCVMMFLTSIFGIYCFASISSASSGTSFPPKEGAWVKGFTAFSNEYLAEEKKGNGWAYRKKVLLEYGAFVRTKTEVSLRDFQYHDDKASRAIQGKAVMVFYLLRRLAGEDAFNSIAKTLAVEAPSRSWDDIRTLFEKETDQDLGWFFKQWVDRKGLPDLHMESAAVRQSGSRFEVSFDIIQKGDIYALEVPVFISFLRGGSTTEIVSVDADRKHAVLFVDDEPSAVVIDRDFTVPRNLTDDETPPLLGKILAEEKLILVAPVSGGDLYTGAVEAWKQAGAEERKPLDLKDADIKTASLVVLGADNPLVNRLYGRIKLGHEALNISARKNPWNPDKIITIIQATSASAAAGSVRSIIESGECSTLTIDGQGNKSQHTAESERGIVSELRAEASAIEVPAMKSLVDVIGKVSEKRIIYVGESHTRYAHHNVQLQVIRDCYRKDQGIAVGMEMFQRPFQKVIDEFISGTIDEREFLKRSEYFKRWSFDYNLYKPILDFARARKIPVVALNIRKEITDKVSKSGMDSLAADERKDIPAQTDFSDDEYRHRLKQVFDQHQEMGERNFDFFYQAQLLWDETMAQSIDEYLQMNPDRRMVVIAGLGHIMYGSGIPKRVLRRHDYTSAMVLNDADVEEGIADYVVFPQPLESVPTPKLMVVLKETEGKVVIMELPEGSISKKAGIRAGDIIVSLDGVPVQGLDDVKIALFYKKQQETIRVKVIRKRFLLGEKEMEIDVKFP